MPFRTMQRDKSAASSVAALIALLLLLWWAWKIFFTIEAAVLLPLHQHQHEAGDPGDPWQRPGQTSWRLFLVFNRNLPAFRLVVGGILFSSTVMPHNIIIVDNSLSHEVWHDRELSSIATEVIRTHEVLSYSAVLNFITDLALQRQLEFYFVAQSDRYTLPRSAEASFDSDVFGCLHEQIDGKLDWGVVFFDYHNFVALRVQTMVQVPWDPTLHRYGSLIDPRNVPPPYYSVSPLLQVQTATSLDASRLPSTPQQHVGSRDTWSSSVLWTFAAAIPIASECAS